MNKIIVAIDGPAGAGKSTVSRHVASRLGVPYLDTGAIYRAVAWKMDKLGITDDCEIAKTLPSVKIKITPGKMFVDGADVTEEIRTEKIDKLVSCYAAKEIVRSSMLDLQRSQAEDGIVADGRDIGTVVFPDAELKIFLTASAEERASRRYKERIAKGIEADYDAILKQVIERDNYDMHREIAPLRPADGCVILDSTTMTLDEVVDVIASLAEEIKNR